MKSSISNTHREIDASAKFPERLASNSRQPREVQQQAKVTKLTRLVREAVLTHGAIPKDGQRGYEEIDLDNSSAIDLKKRFPVSHRFVIKEMFPWLAGFTVLILIYWLNFGIPISSGKSSMFSNALWREDSPLYADDLLLFGSAFAVLTITWLYYELQRYFFQYRIEGSLPLLPIAEVFSRRGVLDVLLGLYQVNVAVPVDSVKSFAQIDGLNSKNATSLIDFLSAQLSRQVTIATPEVAQAMTSP